MTMRQELIMDLALELGMTVQDLSARMTERELVQWNRYRLQKMLPARRLELYCAQIAMLIARTMGGDTTSSLQDFLIEIQMPTEMETPMTDQELAALKDEIGFSPVNRTTH